MLSEMSMQPPKVMKKIDQDSTQPRQGRRIIAQRFQRWGRCKGCSQSRKGRRLTESLNTFSTTADQGFESHFVTACFFSWFLLLVVLLASTGCSRKATGQAITTTTTNDQTRELCGKRDDGLTHVPPAYNSFLPPALGSSYSDPQYGCTIARLTDGKAQFRLAIHHQYASISAINQDDTLVMLVTEWGKGVIVNTAGDLVVSPQAFPAISTGNVPWARAPANAFYYTSKNTLYEGEVLGHTVKSAALHTFSGSSDVIIPDQEDLSEDGDHLWLVAGSQAFLYSIRGRTSGPAVNIGVKDTNCGWHKIQITPSNKMLITWACDGGTLGRGQEVYSPDGTLYWHMLNSSVHTDVGKDLTGNEVAVVGRMPDTYRDACPSGGGVDTIRIDAPHILSCLVDVNWLPTHISYRDSSEGWVAISFFDQGACPNGSCFHPQHLDPRWESTWRHFSEELVLAKIDGSAVVRLAHHRSRSAEYYWAQSRAAISRDGRYLVFDSNMNRSETGLNDYADVYLIRVRETK
jgi:hypothetical protein